MKKMFLMSIICFMLLLCAVGCGNSSESSDSENTSEGSSSSSGLTIENPTEISNLVCEMLSK